VNPRRELVWGMYRRGTSLESIAQQTRNFLDLGVQQASSYLRREQRRGHVLSGAAFHRCQNISLYRREEITLTPEICLNGIITHTEPSPYEICYLCGKIVPPPIRYLTSPISRPSFKFGIASAQTPSTSRSSPKHRREALPAHLPERSSPSDAVVAFANVAAVANEPSPPQRMKPEWEIFKELMTEQFRMGSSKELNLDISEAMGERMKMSLTGVESMTFGLGDGGRPARCDDPPPPDPPPPFNGPADVVNEFEDFFDFAEFDSFETYVDIDQTMAPELPIWIPN